MVEGMPRKIYVPDPNPPSVWTPASVQKMVIGIVAGSVAAVTGGIAAYQRPAQVVNWLPAILGISFALILIGIIVWRLFIKDKCPSEK